MKLVIFIILANIFCSTILAQDNFYIENNQVSWQQIYETSYYPHQLIKEALSGNMFSNYRSNDTQITGEIKDIIIDSHKYGYNNLNTPIIILNYTYSAFVSIDFKEGKYRVTMTDIIITQRMKDPFNPENTKLRFEELALKKGKFKNIMTSAALPILDKYFTEYFTIEPDLNSDNW